jgi:hypothetical protein
MTLFYFINEFYKLLQIMDHKESPQGSANQKKLKGGSKQMFSCQSFSNVPIELTV